MSMAWASGRAAFIGRSSAVNQIEPDVVVMAAHRPSPKEYLLGANAARVARHAGCSILIVRE